MKAPYGWIWTKGGFRKLTPRAFNRRLRRAHNHRLTTRSPKTRETKADNTTKEEIT
jgi:hypothetical protein